MLARNRKITLLTLIVAFSGVGTTLASTASTAPAFVGPLRHTGCVSQGPVIPRQTGKELVAPIACPRLP
jgi:hypothetical protein